MRPACTTNHYHHSLRKYLAWPIALLAMAVVAGCGGGAQSEASCTLSASQTQALEVEMGSQLAQADSEVDFSFSVQRKDGHRYNFNRGASTLQTHYESASTSKLVASVMILRLVERGYLSLSDRPQDLIASWPIAPGDTLYSMTLADLMSFTSGLTVEPTCINDSNAINDGTSEFEACVLDIASANAGNGLVPGSQFYYSATHQQVAGLMAVKARGVSRWQDIWDEFKTQTGLFATSTYDVPSPVNPRVAGGIHFTGEEYMEFLQALNEGRLLNAQSMSQLLADHTASVPIVYSPFMAGIGGGPGLGEDWHFGYGVALECRSAVFNCVAGERVSSPGALGSYPFWDRSKNYTGIVVRQGAYGTLIKGINIERSIQPTIERWAGCG